MPQDSVIMKRCLICGKRVTIEDRTHDANGVYHESCKNAVNEPKVLVRSQPIDRSEIAEYIVDGLIDDMGKMPTAYFDVLVVVTAIVTPLPDLPDAGDELGLENH